MRILTQFEPLDPAVGVAMDEVLLDAARNNGRTTLRLWVNRRAVVIGRSQCLIDEVDERQAAALEYVVVRRLSGGGAVLHDPGNLNLTVVGPKRKGLRTVREVFSVFGNALAEGLQAFGLVVRVAENSLFVDGRKLSGAAQIHRGETMLYHATLLRSLPEHPMERLLLALRSSYRSQAVASTPRPVTSIERCTGLALSAEALIAPVTHAFARVLDAQPQSKQGTAAEIARAEELAAVRYRRESWTRCL